MPFNIDRLRLHQKQKQVVFFALRCMLPLLSFKDSLTGLKPKYMDHESKVLSFTKNLKYIYEICFVLLIKFIIDATVLHLNICMLALLLQNIYLWDPKGEIKKLTNFQSGKLLAIHLLSNVHF